MPGATETGPEGAADSSAYPDQNSEPPLSAGLGPAEADDHSGTQSSDPGHGFWMPGATEASPAESNVGTLSDEINRIVTDIIDSVVTQEGPGAVEAASAAIQDEAQPMGEDHSSDCPQGWASADAQAAPESTSEASSVQHGDGLSTYDELQPSHKLGAARDYDDDEMQAVQYHREQAGMLEARILDIEKIHSDSVEAITTERDHLSKKLGQLQTLHDMNQVEVHVFIVFIHPSN